MVKFNPGWGWDYKFGLLELLIKRGYSITPGTPCAEDDIRFPGGYTVRTHGGWQFEISFSNTGFHIQKRKIGEKSRGNYFYIL